MVCDPLGNNNVWGSTKSLNNSANGHSENETVVIAAARVSTVSSALISQPSFCFSHQLYVLPPPLAVAHYYCINAVTLTVLDISVIPQRNVE